LDGASDVYPFSRAQEASLSHPPMVKAVIFDIDGTLIDSVDMHARAWQETFLRYGVKTDFRAVREQIGKGGDKLMKVFLSEEQIERWGKEIEAERAELFKRRYLPHVKPFPRLQGLFERLRKDEIEIALASSAKDDELQAYKKITGIGPYLSEETSSDDVENSKPDPDIFLAARRKLGIDPRNVIAIGDTPYDAESAGQAGMATIGLLCGGCSPAKLRAAGCVALYKDPADMLNHYDHSPLAASGMGRITAGYGYKEKFMNSNNTLYFLMGLGIGAAAGVLYAPKSGPEARGFLRSKSEEGVRYARQAASDARDRAKQKVDELRQTAVETVGSATLNRKGPMEA
jgi:HAD superfamily hydrolase (TIGR01509 family)